MTHRRGLAATWPEHKHRVLVALFATLTLGLAPYYPHAHVWKQLVSAARGTLVEPVDMLDLAMHGAPWLALAYVVAQWARSAATRGNGGSVDVPAP